ncbi:MAG: dTDP-4-dehydrorhamnose 3,5-epimerase [Hyphomicrobiales bacterium]
MISTPLDIEDVLILQPQIFEDDRGFFFESYNQRKFQETTGLDLSFVQDNHSRSAKGVLRGLHFQRAPLGQGKLVRVLQGEIFDVAVDIRPGSKSFGKWVSAVLSADNKKQIWIPDGFAHGFLTLSETAELSYKTTQFYSAESEGCLQWNDPDVNIKWPLDVPPLLSGKDRDGVTLNQLLN